jgi:hypothetical protein
MALSFFVLWVVGFLLSPHSPAEPIMSAYNRLVQKVAEQAAKVSLSFQLVGFFWLDLRRLLRHFRLASPCGRAPRLLYQAPGMVLALVSWLLCQRTQQVRSNRGAFRV